MVRLVVLWKRPTNIVAFERYYADVHIPLVKKLAGLRNYTIARNPVAVRGNDSYYCIAEADWDDITALTDAFQSKEGQAASQDVANLARWSHEPQTMIYEVHEV